jgi:hypothetical protein
MLTNKENIINVAISLLKQNSDGLRYMQLFNLIKKELPNIPTKTIESNIWNLDQKFPNQIYKPKIGLFKHIKYKNISASKKQ